MVHPASFEMATILGAFFLRRRKSLVLVKAVKIASARMSAVRL